MKSKVQYETMAASPTAILSLDYELFFGRSGTAEKCLFEPCEALDRMSSRTGIKLTYFVDIGMLQKMDEYAARDRAVRTLAARIRRHLAELHRAGHDIALHIHPHWSETRLVAGEWDFSGTRYALREFSPAQVHDIVTTGADCLAAITESRPESYRAGGFCVEPFAAVAAALRSAAIHTDSSVVPGASLAAAHKGFDFRDAPATDWWLFDDNPLDAQDEGEFLELPIGTVRLPRTYYWSRLWQRLCGARSADCFGDGNSISPGRREILLRLAGSSRVSELSIDAAKSGLLASVQVSNQARNLWHVMGHPKLVSTASLQDFEFFLRNNGITEFDTVASAARRIRTDGPQRAAQSV